MLLCQLGEHGDDVYEKFLAALELTGYGRLVRDLRKTYRYTYFGKKGSEMLL